MNGLHGIQPYRSDVRGFVHKKIARGVVGGVTGFIRGGPGGAVGGAVSGFVGGGAPAATVCPPGFNPTAAGGCAPRSVTLRAPAFTRGIRALRGGGQLDIIEPRGVPLVPQPGITGFIKRIIPGGDTGFDAPGPAVMPPTAGVPMGAPGLATLGRFGAAVEPTFRSSTIRDCPRGMVLAVDSLCYSRRDVRNSERFWPRGRRPLLTGGEMRAISTAASAARKLQRKQKDLQELGLLPKPTARRKKGAVPGHKATLAHA